MARARVVKSNLPKAMFLPFGRQCIAGVFGLNLYVQKAGRGTEPKGSVYRYPSCVFYKSVQHLCLKTTGFG